MVAENACDRLRTSICLQFTNLGSWHAEIMNPRSQDQIHVHPSQQASGEWWVKQRPRQLDLLQSLWLCVHAELIAKKESWQEWVDCNII